MLILVESCRLLASLERTTRCLAPLMVVDLATDRELNGSYSGLCPRTIFFRGIRGIQASAPALIQMFSRRP